MLVCEAVAVDDRVEQRRQAGALEHRPAVLRRRHAAYPAPLGRKRADQRHRALEYLDAFLAHHLGEQLVLAVAQPADGLRAGPILRRSPRKLDAARRHSVACRRHRPCSRPAGETA